MNRPGHILDEGVSKKNGPSSKDLGIKPLFADLGSWCLQERRIFQGPRSGKSSFPRGLERCCIFTIAAKRGNERKTDMGWKKVFANSFLRANPRSGEEGKSGWGCWRRKKAFFPLWLKGTSIPSSWTEWFKSKRKFPFIGTFFWGNPCLIHRPLDLSLKGSPLIWYGRRSSSSERGRPKPRDVELRRRPKRSLDKGPKDMRIKLDKSLWSNTR